MSALDKLKLAQERAKSLWKGLDTNYIGIPGNKMRY